MKKKYFQLILKSIEIIENSYQLDKYTRFKHKRGEYSVNDLAIETVKELITQKKYPASHNVERIFDVADYAIKLKLDGD